MSDILTMLRQEAKDLRLLAADLDRLAADWSRQLDATRFLGVGVPVEAWALADHFLLIWSDWHGLRSRYDRYFGVKDDFWPRWWQELDGRCKHAAARFWDDREFQKLIADSWHEDARWHSNRPAPSRATDEPAEGVSADVAAESDALARHAMMGHERMTLVSMFASDREAAPVPTIDVVWEQNRQLISEFDRAAPETRSEVIWQLRNYRHATLQVSWLGGNGSQPRRHETALEHALADDERAARLAETFIEPTLYNLRHDEDRQIVTRIVRAVSEVGYEHFFDDVTSREMHGGHDSPLGAEAVQVIPGGPSIEQQAVVVALSRRGRRGASLGTTLTRVCQRLADRAAARTVIVVSDSWDAGLFAEVAAERFAEHHGRGMDFVFLVVGLPEQIVSPIPVLLNGQPVQNGPQQPYRRLKLD